MTFTFNTSVSVTPFGSMNAKIRMGGNMLQEVLPEEDTVLQLPYRGGTKTIVRYYDVAPLHRSEQIIEQNSIEYPV